MPLDDFKRHLTKQLTDFCWQQWSQMGVLSQAAVKEKRPADPEALLLLTLEVGRNDPRLHDEVSDWFVTNKKLLSTRRLRSLARNPEDKALLDATTAWAAEWVKVPSLAQVALPGLNPEREPELPDGRLEPFYRESRLTVSAPDPAFLKSGFLKTLQRPSQKSQAPDLLAPINFAFRLRAILGNGVRSELVRVLWSQSDSDMSVRQLSDAAAYSVRNVKETVDEMLNARVIVQSTKGPARYQLPRDRWRYLLFDSGEMPGYVPWPDLLLAFRLVFRWIWNVPESEFGSYPTASSAAQLLDKIQPLLPADGSIIVPGMAGDPVFLQRFEEYLDDNLKILNQPSPA